MHYKDKNSLPIPRCPTENHPPRYRNTPMKWTKENY